MSIAEFKSARNFAPEPSRMELLVAPVEHITFDLENALSQQLGKFGVLYISLKTSVSDSDLV